MYARTLSVCVTTSAISSNSSLVKPVQSSSRYRQSKSGQLVCFDIFFTAKILRIFARSLVCHKLDLSPVAKTCCSATTTHTMLLQPNVVKVLVIIVKLWFALWTSSCTACFREIVIRQIGMKVSNYYITNRTGTPTIIVVLIINAWTKRSCRCRSTDFCCKLLLILYYVIIRLYNDLKL